MKRHENLQFFIKALAAQEQRQLFQKAISGSTPQPARLLKLLCKQPHMSAAAAAQQLNLSGNRYKNLCAKTYDILLRLHGQQKLETTIPYQVQQLQAAAETQKQASRYADAQKTLTRALALAQRFELHAAEITLHYQLLQLLFYRPASAKPAPLYYLQRVEDLMPLQIQTTTLHLIYQRLLLLRYQYALCISPNEQQQLDALADQLQSTAPQAPASATARIYFYQSRLLICFMLGRTHAIVDYNQALLYCWQQHSHLIPLHPELFIRSVSVQAYTHFLAQEAALVSRFLEAYTLLAGQLSVAGHQHWFEVIRFHTRLKVLHKTYQYEELALFFAAQWPQVYPALYALPGPEKIDILLSACITLFALQRWPEAEALILETKEENRTLRRSDTLYFTFIFHCLILFEQREWSRLHSLINSEYLFLYRNRALRPFERDMLLFIKKLPLLTISANGKRGLQQFLQKLASYKQHPVHRLHFAYFDFYTWVASKTEGVSYMELVRRNAAQNTLAAV